MQDLMLHVHVPAALKPAFTITHPVTQVLRFPSVVCRISSHLQPKASPLWMQDSPLNGKSEQDIVKASSNGPEDSSVVVGLGSLH